VRAGYGSYSRVYYQFRYGFGCGFGCGSVRVGYGLRIAGRNRSAGRTASDLHLRILNQPEGGGPYFQISKTSWLELFLLRKTSTWVPCPGALCLLSELAPRNCLCLCAEQRAGSTRFCSNVLVSLLCQKEVRSITTAR